MACTKASSLCKALLCYLFLVTAVTARLPAPRSLSRTYNGRFVAFVDTLYSLSPSLSGDDQGTPVNATQFNFANNQLWKLVTKDHGETWMIQNVATGTVMDNNLGNQSVIGTPIIGNAADVDSDNQSWYIHVFLSGQADEHVLVKNTVTGLDMDLYGGEPTSTSIVQYTNDDNDYAVRWFLWTAPDVYA